MRNNKNEQAFPYYDSTGSISGTGLTKREYFAAMAMQGILSNSEFTKILQETRSVIDHCEFVTKCAIEQADELLKQLKN